VSTFLKLQEKKDWDDQESRDALFYMEAEGDLFKNRGDDERDEEDDIKA
jgi:hypothetical protein